MLNKGTLFHGRYRIIEPVGSGGMADVYKAEDQKENRIVAIKVLKRELSREADCVRRFQQEGKAASSLNNENIVSVYYVGNTGETYYIVMEFVDGITLKEYIRRKGLLSPKETMAIASQICVGLRAAHAKHIIHRDVKPQNMILSRNGKVKVADFGIARAMSEETRTLTQNTMGSVHYISPEQAKGQICDERSDIYSLGVVMYEMITGRVPFDKETSVAVALAHMNEAMVPPSRLNPECPIALEQIIFRSTQKSRDRRYLNCTEMLQDLKIAVQNPDYDFEKQEQASLADGHTHQFTNSEVSQLRNAASKEARAAAFRGETLAQNTPVTRGTAQRPAAENAKAANTQRKAAGGTGSGIGEKTAFDHSLSAIGVMVGLVCLAMAIYIISTLSGCRDRRPPKPTGSGGYTESTETSPVITTE
ncbi:MAG: serine/threonine protein kinase, partial [Lachnospiraceae bacterium]|nr:serine/threonine protein kinase [Lachnospiraceae bacterium]